MAVGSILALDAKKDTEFARQAMNQMGQTLLAPPSVKGWDGQEVWINANTILQRYNFALDLVMREDDRFTTHFKSQDPGHVVDELSKLLLDGRITPAARSQFVAYVTQSRQSFDQRVRGVAHLMMCTPEYQLS